MSKGAPVRLVAVISHHDVESVEAPLRDALHDLELDVKPAPREEDQLPAMRIEVSVPAAELESVRARITAEAKRLGCSVMAAG